MRSRRTGLQLLGSYGAALLVPALVTAGLRLAGVRAAGAALTYVLAVLLVTDLGDQGAGTVTAALATAALAAFFLPPAQPTKAFALLAFLITAAAGAQLLGRARLRLGRVQAQAAHADRLLQLCARMLAHVVRPGDAAAALAALARDCGRTLGAQRALLQLWGSDGAPVYYPAEEVATWPADWLQAAQRAAEGAAGGPARVAGGPGGDLLVLPLGRSTALPAALIAEGCPAEGGALAEAVASLAALALERLLLLQRVTDAEALRQSEQLKSTLLSSISHQLRTPLSAIRVAATALQRPEVWADASSRGELLRTLDEEAQRLNRVIGNLLCMSRIEAGPLALQRQPCEVGELLWEAVRQTGHLRSLGRLHLELGDELPALDCDLGLAAVALANLLDNAAKYSPAQAPIDVVAHYRPERGEVALAVQDRGPGIPRHEAERVFDPFYRGGERRGQAVAGIGLGLSIARALVQAHGGRLWVEARPGGGSIFTCTWPVAHQARASDAPEAPAAAAVGVGGRP